MLSRYCKEVIRMAKKVKENKKKQVKKQSPRRPRKGEPLTMDNARNPYKGKPRNNNRTRPIKSERKSSIFDVRRRLRSISNLKKSGWFETLAGRLSFLITKGRSKQDFDFSQLGTGQYIAIEDKIYSASSIIKPIGIVSVGNVLIRGYLQDIRDEVARMADTYNQETDSSTRVAVNEYVINKPSKIQFSSDKRLQRDYDRASEDNTVDDSVLMSYDWLAEMDADESESLWENQTALEFVFYGDATERLAELYQRVMEWFDKYTKRAKIIWKDMYLTVQEYQRYFSSLGYQGKRTILSKDEIVGKNIRNPNQTFASTDNLIEGNVSDPNGVIVGININSSQAYAINFSKEDYPVITLFTQLTGTGKTFSVQMIIDGMLLQPDLYEPVIVDRKNEYSRFATTSGLRLISFSTESGQYIDTTEIPDPIGEREYDGRIANLSRENTKSVFKALLYNIWSPEVELALDFVIEELYNNVGYRKEDPATYKFTRGLSYYSIYTNIDRVKADNPTQAEARAPLPTYTAIRNQLRDYFEEGGVASDMFRHKLTLKELADSRGIVFALDPYGSDVKSNSVSEELSLLFVSFYVAERQLRKNKKQIMLFVEEAQELLKIESFANKISALATMGRSGGIKMFFITNAPNIFFDTIDSKNDDSKTATMKSAASAIASNIGAAFIGPNKASNMVALKKMFSANDTTDAYLDMLAHQADVNQKSLQHKLFIADGHTHTMVDIVAHQSLVDMDAYGTRTKFAVEGQKELSIDELRREALSADDKTLNEYGQSYNNDRNVMTRRQSDIGESLPSRDE